MEIYRGENISPGVAFGRAFVFQEIMHARYTRVTILPEKAVFEQKRVREAIDASIREIAELITKVNDDLGYDESTIFQVHRGILEDPSFFDEIVTLIGDELVNAETAVRAVVERWEQRFAAAPSPQFAMKAADLLDIGKRIMANLCYGGAVCPFRDDLSFPEMGQDVIFVARMLLPSVSAYIDPRRVKGIIAELGNKSSHSAVIAKSLGLPTVFGVEHALARITDGDEVIIDGSAGIVFVRPDEKIRKEYETFRADFTRYQSRIETLSELPAVTTDGVSILL